MYNMDENATVAIALTLFAIAAAFRVRLGDTLARRIWLGVSLVALGATWLGGFVDAVGIVILAGFGTLAWYVSRTDVPRLRIGGYVLLAVTSLALAMHALPGFHNPRLIDPQLLSLDSSVFQLYANFDKAWVGIVLVALLLHRSASAVAWRSAALTTAVIGTLTVVATLAIASSINVVRLDPKLPDFTLLALVTNLFFTVIPEEAFFRLLIQTPLSQRFATVRYGTVYTVAITATLFALAHFAGGLQYMLLAGIAGVGYALVYAKTQRLSAAVATHFGFNVVHFLYFSYPQLAVTPQSITG